MKPTKRSLSDAMPGECWELRENRIRRKLCLDRCFMKKCCEKFHPLDDVWPQILNYVEQLRLLDWWKQGQIQHFESRFGICCTPYEYGQLFMDGWNYNTRDTALVFSYWHKFCQEVIEKKVLYDLHCGTTQSCTYWSVKEQAIHTWTVQHFLA